MFDKHFIFAGSPADDVSIEAARDFIKQNAFTQDQVRISKIGNTVCVITKEGFLWPPPRQE